MTFNRVKLGRAVTFMKYLASVVSLIFLPKALMWNKITFPTSNSMNFAELVGKWAYEEDLQKKFTNIPFPIQFTAAYCKDFKIFLAGIYLFKINNGTTRTMCEICSKLKIKTPKERTCLHHSSVFIVNFEQILQIVLVFP